MQAREKEEITIYMYYFFSHTHPPPLPLTTFFTPHLPEGCYFYSALSFSVIKDGSHANADKQFLPNLKIWLHCWLA